MTRVALFTVVVIVMTLALSSALWWMIVSPHANGLVPHVVLRVLAFPVGVVGWAMGRGAPDSLSALMGPCEFCSPRQHYIHFLEAAVPAYGLPLLLLGALITARKSRPASN